MTIHLVLCNQCACRRVGQSELLVTLIIYKERLISEDTLQLITGPSRRSQQLVTV